MKLSANQDAFGWILWILSCISFVACGANEDRRVDLSRDDASATDFEPYETPSLRLENALAPVSEISDVLRLSTRRFYSYCATRRLNLPEGVPRTFQTLANRLTFERLGLQLFLFRSFWASSLRSSPLFISFLTLRN